MTDSWKERTGRGSQPSPLADYLKKKKNVLSPELEKKSKSLDFTHSA